MSLDISEGGNSVYKGMKTVYWATIHYEWRMEIVGRMFEMQVEAR